MNIKRRELLKAALLAGVAGPLPAAFAQSKRAGRQHALLISTWNYGRKANAVAWPILEKGGSSLDAVEAGVKLAEADPGARTVGYGGLPDREGKVTLDACIMDSRFNCGAVLCLEQIMHPVSVARMVMEKTPHIYLAGEGALQFALANGFKKTNLLTPESEADYKEWLKTSNYKPEKNIENRLGGELNHDTIGMLALDGSGNLSGACTTSGMAYKMRGRVGDSPIIGSGLYVDNAAGAATASGVGEEIIRIAGAHLIVSYMEQGLAPEAACRKAVEKIVKINPDKSRDLQVGFIALAPTGAYGGYSIQPGFTYAVKSATKEEVFNAKSFYR
ncbi:isoaspartyl peptidase/L-asparaginase family protein [Flavihumibacter sp. UBA7668]|uniref:isoaspartyl peptidase/L-asparaginase family protein n=1 Tax=Flavihumibacter sp. UBA7668 TaxID=1946542 RepID=UPI0025BBEB9C|nr:N(4)-(beta-N-acetylglucosaminyl)-L-asparaginase [Flavihumibacter sp. UBA7668]